MCLTGPMFDCRSSRIYSRFEVGTDDRGLVDAFRRRQLALDFARRFSLDCREVVVVADTMARAGSVCVFAYQEGRLVGMG